MKQRLAAAVSVCASAALSVATLAQAPAAQRLPLDNLGLEHLDIIVPDPAASARFYARVFKTTLHQQPVRDTLRYFVLLGNLRQDRQVGYIAIGAAGDRPSAIGHYCVLAQGVSTRRLRERSEGSGAAIRGDRARGHRHVARS
jgi:catechol 2,3-dioxygenase-like lactoylglutathione lyase family enzyme